MSCWLIYYLLLRKPSLVLLVPLHSHPQVFTSWCWCTLFTLLDISPHSSPVHHTPPPIFYLGKSHLFLKTQYRYYLFWECLLHVNSKKIVVDFVPHVICSCITVPKLWAESGHTCHIYVFFKHFLKKNTISQSLGSSPENEREGLR